MGMVTQTPSSHHGERGREVWSGSKTEEIRRASGIVT